MSVKVLIVDDHDIVRFGLRELIGAETGFEVVGEAGTVAEALVKARASRPDVVVMDVRLPDGSGADACRAICAEFPSTRVLMLTSYSDEEAVLASVAAGAAGYVLKRLETRSLIEAIATVARGGSLLDPAVTPAVLERVRTHESKPPAADALTPQETRILGLIGEGKTNREIAEALMLSENTVRNHVSNIFGKLGVSHRSQAAIYAVRHGLSGSGPDGNGPHGGG